eukprot:GGOE01014239.1.p1 GENE.GGOE01014239.1~~GGOE01014239.1.p1  ORF type:complete len:287 (-),score=80.58 GGOE01014239.1:267-1061(-)
MASATHPDTCATNTTRGWDGSFDSVLDSGLCSIPRVPTSTLTLDDFLTRYKDQEAVILVNAANNSVIQKATERQALLETFGTAPVVLSSANTYSYETVDQSLATYLEELMVPQGLQQSGRETFYNFGGHNPTVWNPLLRFYQRPPFIKAGGRHAYSFGIGASGSGVPFHVHGDGFSEVLHGRKRWFLYRPGQEPQLEGFEQQRERFFQPDESSLQWVAEVYPALAPSQRPLECVIGPGEVLYFPSMWFHATLNLGETVFISTFI